MALTDKIDDLATAVATEVKRNRTWINGNMADLSGLNTTNKSNLVAAINEVKTTADSAAGGGTSIDDTQVRTDATWSSSKIDTQIKGLVNDTTSSANTVYSSQKTEQAIADVKAEILGGASAAFDTLLELENAVGSNESAIGGLTTEIGNRVRYDAAQTLTSLQKTTACTNIGVGEPETDFVATFNAGLA